MNSPIGRGCVVLEELLDGCYVVSADVEAAQMDKEQIVAA